MLDRPANSSSGPREPIAGRSFLRTFRTFEECLDRILFSPFFYCLHCFASQDFQLLFRPLGSLSVAYVDEIEIIFDELRNITGRQVGVAACAVAAPGACELIAGFAVEVGARP